MEKQQTGNNSLPLWLLCLICWPLSLFLLVLFILATGFPPPAQISYSSWVYIVVAVFLLLVPFSSRMRLGNILEYERKIEQVNQRLEEFQSETRNSISLISSSLTTISNVSNINVYTSPQANERTKANTQIKKVGSKKTRDEASMIKKELVLEDEELIMPLARTRILLEQNLRKILGKSRTKEFSDRHDIKYLSANSLFKIFLDQYPGNKQLEEPFNYVIRVCNAALHGQRIASNDAHSALDLGSIIIAFLSDFAGNKED